MSRATSTTTLLKNDDFDVFDISNVRLDRVNEVNPSGAIGTTNMVATTGNVQHTIRTIVQLTSSTTYTFSVYVKVVVYPYLYMRCSGTGTGNYCAVVFDINEKQIIDFMPPRRWPMSSKTIIDVGNE